MRLRNRLAILLTLLVLILTVMLPKYYSALDDLHAAQEAGIARRYSDSARLYESAARQLFWQNGLWEKAGLADYYLGDWQNAVRLLGIARQKNSISAQGWDALGSATWNLNLQGSALSVWKSGMQAYPSFVPLLDHLALAEHEQGNYAAEEPILIKRLALGNDAASHYRLGLLLSLSDLSRAQTEFSAASALSPEFDQAVQTLQAALNIAALESDPARRLVVVGRGLGLVEQWGLASMAFEQAASLDPNNAEAWAWLGEVRQQLGQDGRADLDRASALAPNEPIVHELRGVYLKRQGNLAQALAEYLRAAQLEPSSPAWQAALGDIYTQSGDLIAALSAYQRASTLDSNDATYLRLLAMFCADNHVHVMDVGLPAAQQAAALAPDDPQVLDALGWSYLQSGFPKSAEQDLLKATKAAPQLALPHLHLAEAYLQEGDRSSAASELDLARQLDPNGPTGQFAALLAKQYFP